MFQTQLVYARTIAKGLGVSQFLYPAYLDKLKGTSMSPLLNLPIHPSILSGRSELCHIILIVQELILTTQG